LKHESKLGGTKQSKVHDTKIEDQAGYLGPHSPKLKVGDVQKMVFQEEDEGPYYMPTINQQLLRYDEVNGEKKVEERLVW